MKILETENISKKQRKSVNSGAHVGEARDDHRDSGAEKIDKGRCKPVADGQYCVDDAHGDETIGVVRRVVSFDALYDCALEQTKMEKIWHCDHQ